jgi:lysozyme
MSYYEIVLEQLKIDEGIRNKPYRDTVGKLTIGCGRNLDDVGVSDDEIELMLTNDIASAEDTARRLVLNFDSLSDERKAVVINLAFNLGYTKFSQFHNTLRAIGEERWDDAADGLQNSLWATQVGARATRLIQKMRDG